MKRLCLVLVGVFWLAGLGLLLSGPRVDVEKVSVVTGGVEEVEEVQDENHEPEAWEIAGVPDFTAITDVRAKKKQFFDLMLPLVQQENQRVAKQRERLRELSEKSQLSDSDKTWLTDLGRSYRLSGDPTSQWFDRMLLRVDTLPPSLALAQAANESGWGTSRFSRLGNNYFGQWCFSKGCGLVPSARTTGSAHEVQVFKSVGLSVRAYIRNLNTHNEYEALRELRANARYNNQTVTGAYLAQGLGRYSERGYAYIDELVSMINGNKLTRYDQDHLGLVVADSR